MLCSKGAEVGCSRGCFYRHSVLLLHQLRMLSLHSSLAPWLVSAWLISQIWLVGESNQISKIFWKIFLTLLLTLIFYYITVSTVAAHTWFLAQNVYLPFMERVSAASLTVCSQHGEVLKTDRFMLLKFLCNNKLIFFSTEWCIFHIGLYRTILAWTPCDIPFILTVSDWISWSRWITDNSSSECFFNSCR